jgi:hypothetical protein
MKVINRVHKCFGWVFEFKRRRLALVAILSPPVFAAFTTIAADRTLQRRWRETITPGT